MKLFVVGLDGATFDLLLPLINQGHLPFFKKLLMGSSWGDMESVYPPLTAPAWTSFMTGKKVANHGIFDFFYRKESTYTQALYSIFDINDEIFWRILGENDKTVGIVNLPLTYPTQKVNGFMISGLLTPSGKRDFVYPPQLLKEIEKNVGRYLLHHDQTGDPDLVINQEYEILEYRTKVARYLYSSHELDFFMIHYYGTDRIQHEFWHLIDRDHPLFNQREYDKYWGSILEYYRRLDEALYTLSKIVDEDTIFIIMSDHGFGPIYKFMNMNRWLVEEGFMKFRRNFLTYLKRILFSMGFTYSSMAKLILKFDLGKKAMDFGRDRRQKLQERIFLSLRDVDWGRTYAYSIGNFGQIFINKKGREPKGIVSQGEYEEILDKITGKLLEFSDPQSNEKIIEKVVRNDEIFQGEYFFDAPDLFPITKGMKIKPNGLSDFTSKTILEPAFGSTGHHRLNGIFIAHNPKMIKENNRIREAKIIDMTPTILYSMGCRIPDDIDGRILFDIFEENFVKEHPVYFSGVKKKEIKAEKVQGYGEDEENKIKRELKNLGYM